MATPISFRCASWKAAKSACSCRRRSAQRPVAGNEDVPHRLAARPPERGNTGFELQVEGLAEELLDTLAPAPREGRRRRIDRERQIGPHHREHPFDGVAP